MFLARLFWMQWIAVALEAVPWVMLGVEAQPPEFRIVCQLGSFCETRKVKGI